MKNRWITRAALLLTVLVFFAGTAFAASDQPLSFSTTTLEGQNIDSSIMKDYSLIMINLWAEWCGPCMAELPDLEQIHQDYPNVLLIGAYVSSDKESAIAAAAEAGVTYTLVNVPYPIYDYIEIDSGSYSIPQTCFFDRNGKPLGDSYVGSRSYSAWAAIVEEKLLEAAAAGEEAGDDTGSQEKGWKEIDGVWYFFDDSGAMKTGWLSDGGAWYFFGASGAMATGWAEDGGAWYFFDDSGAMKTGWLLYGNTWYLLKPDGAMATGWQSDGGIWYYFDASGAMATGWLKSGDTWYYLTDSGAMATGWFKDRDATWYWFDENGRMATGWAEINGQWEMFSDSGAWLYTWDGQ